MRIAVLDSSQEIVTSGLLLHLDAAQLRSYPGTGTTWTDLSGNGNFATLINSPAFNTDNGGSIVFDGTNDYAPVRNNASILTTNYTKFCWFRVTSFSPGNNFISGGDGGNHAWWMQSSPQMRAGHNGSYNTVVSPTSLSLNTWYCGAVTFNTTTGWVMYLNGSQNTTSGTTQAFTGSGELLIAAFGSNNFANIFNGRIAIMMVYNRALTAAEILQNYNALKSRFGL